MATDNNARDRAHARRSLGTHKEDADYGLLKGAAAVIAGAAFLRYQPGGRIITRALGRTHQFVKNVGKTIDREIGKDIADMSLRDWRTVGNNLSSDWAKATRETDRVALDPNTGSLSHFVEGIETVLTSNVTGKFGHKNISQTAYQTFMKDVVGKQMRDEVAAHLALSRNDQIKFNAFISQVEKTPMSNLFNRQYMDRMQFTAEQQVHAENILKVMRARAEDAKSGKDLAAKDYMERIDHFLTKAKEDAYTIESLERNLGTLTKTDRDIGKIVGSRKATIGDILDNAQAVQDHTIRKADGGTQSMLQWMRDYESKLNDKEKIRFRNLLVDAENLRVTQQGEFFSQKTGRGWYEDLRNFWAGTMPGQLFKLRELQTQDTVGSFQWFTKTMNNPVLKAKLEKMGDADNYHYRIGKDIYSMDEQGNTKLVIEDAKMVSGRVGFFHGQLEAMSGLYKIKESDNAVLRWLDLFQDREHYSGSNIANFFSRFGENRRQTELVDLLRNPNFKQSRALEDAVLDLAANGENAAKQSIDYVYQYGEILRKAERVLQTNTYQIDEHLLDQLSSKANQDSNVFFDLLKKDTRDIEDALLDPAQAFQLFEGSQFLNPKLRSLVDSLRRDPTKTRNTYELVTDPERLLISTSEESAVSGSLGNQTLYYEDILRKELGKEAILRQGLEGTSRQGKNLNYDNINALIDQIQGNPNSIKELRKLTQTAIFQHSTDIAGSIKKEPYELLQQIASARAILQGTSDSERSFQAVYDTIMKDEIGWLEASQIGDATPGIGSLDDFVYINRTTTPLDLISGLNEAILQKSMNPLYNRASSFANQFLAGRGNMEYISEITMAPYFMLKRLSDELNTVGLGFSGDNLGSTVDLASAIMTKRVLPIGLGLTYFDWLDDTTREVTGQSLSGAFVNGIANVDLAGRRVISGLGLDEWIREEKNINPILQYWFEKDEYQGYEERKDYYERGYDPVRKAAWWTWGGVSEARGGEITYFTPSYARRINSNYKDEAIYGGYFNKWYNTWIPTPVNPLAPLLQFFNPYSLEEQHEEDRPYAYSGPLFTESTPWGALLNPTIGEILKPEKELHPYRLRNGVDAYALIDEINRSILQKARDFTSTNYMEFRGNSITAQWFNAWNAPIQGSRVLSYRSVGGSVAYVPSSVYGVYPENGDGTGGVPLLGSPNVYGFRSPSEGLNPAGGFHQDQSAGFNALSEMNGSAERLYALTQQGKSPGLRRLFDQWVFGDTNVLLQHGDIIMNEEGELGIYKDHKEKHPKGAKLTFRQYMKYQQVVDSEHSYFTKQALIDAADSFDVNKQLSAINARTKQLAREKVDSPWQIDEDEGFMSGQTLASYRPSQAMDVLNDAEAVTDLLNASSGSDFIREATMSARLIGGIYGYMGSAAAGIGVYNEKRPQRSDAMTAWNRTFWDYNMGGFGGITSEIMRRFIPPYSSSKYFSPLKNNMPEWLPSRFRSGDAYCVTPSTLIEIGNLQFIAADQVTVGQQLFTHNGTLEPVHNIAVRNIEQQEKLYRFQITSLNPVTSTYSENHPILVYSQNALSDVSQHSKQDISKLMRYNDIITCLINGITNKKQISFITGINIDWLYQYLKELTRLGIIEDYKKNKHTVFPVQENLQLFDLKFIEHRLEWRKAKDIQVGDYVAYPLPEYTENTVTIDLASISEYPASDNYLYISGQCKRQDFIEAYEWLENQQKVPQFRHGERQTFLKDHGWSSKAYEKAVDQIKRHIVPERMSRYIELSPELCYAIGLWLAEGTCDGGGIHYHLHMKEQHLFERSVKGIIEAGFPIKSYCFTRINNTNGATGHVYCTILSVFMQYLIGKRAHSKQLHELFWNLRKDNLLRFFEGYIDGDGYNSYIKTGYSQRDSYRIGIASCNLFLLLQIRKLALRFGIILSIKEKPAPSEPKQINGIVVHTGINYYAEVRGQMAIQFAKQLWDMDIQVPVWRRAASRHSFIFGDYLYMRVRDITEYTIDDYPVVIGFEMPHSKSFCTAGVATHNTTIPEGEARLPGKGWEALNEYHSDMYSTEEDRTGAFDRYKILADIAPGSAEYKLWRDIAKKTVTDPELIAEMDEIRDRANRQSRKHDFYPYLIAGHDLQYQNVVVSEILGYGKFRSGSQIYKMAGISINGNEDESQTDVLNRYIHVGQTVTIATDVNASEGTNKDAQKSVNATVFLNGENINRAMLDAGDAKKRKGDTSASATLASLTTTQVAFGRMAEVIGHLDIPIISDQWLRVRSPIESYRAEYIYGTPYQSWAHPIDTFVQPAFERAIHEPNMAGNLLWWAFTHTDRWREHTPEIRVGSIHVDSRHIGRGPRGPLTVAALLMNREALIGAGIGLILKQDASFAMKAARASYNITNLARFVVGGNSMLTQMISGAMLGSWVTGTLLEQGHGKGAVIGAAAGAAWRFITGHAGDGPWVPERTKKNWESTDYFDRLQYLKYMGLYHEAARRAKEEEGVDVEELMEQQQEEEDQRQKKLSGLKRLKKELNEAYGGKTSPLKKELLKLVNSRTSELQPESMYARGGEYTNSAILYKQAADRTMYGLRDGASWSEVMSALPTTDRDYFMEFINEKDPQKRAEILATVSPFLQRALRMQWHMEQEERPTNSEFFEDHYLPDSDWEGWRPDVDIRDIQVKTIENQAQNLSDFGYYESQLRNPGVIMAEPLDMNRPTDAWSTRLAIRKILQGQGLRDVEVSVSERSTMSFAQIKAAIKTFISPKDQQRRIDDSISRQTGAA